MAFIPLIWYRPQVQRGAMNCATTNHAECQKHILPSINQAAPGAVPVCVDASNNYAHPSYKLERL